MTLISSWRRYKLSQPLRITSYYSYHHYKFLYFELNH